MKTCNRKILELFYNVKHTGRISKPDAIGRVGEDDEGLVIELTWRVMGGVIAEAKFRAFANPNAIAITSLMVDNIIGKSVDEAILIGEDVIIDNLGEFKPEYLEVYDMVRECIADAYNNYFKRQSRTAGDTSTDVEEFNYEEYLATHNIEEGQEIDIEQIQLELTRSRATDSESRGRGKPRKPVDENAVVEVGEKRGRGRPRKEVDSNAIVEVGEKRGRGRPRKPVDENAVVEVGEKRGRGRPRKPVDENAVVEVGEKRGRGRPRKEVDPNAIVEVGEKRGRGRPRKVVDETEMVEMGEKRGRGRPRKPVDENAVVEAGEKRGRGRPRKEVDINVVVEPGEKRGRGRPKKEVKFNLPSDLDDVIGDEEVELLINGNSHTKSSSTEVPAQHTEVEIEPVSNLLEEDDEDFDADYDLFKSNIRNILSGKEVSNQNYTNTVVEQVKHTNIEQDETLNEVSVEEDYEEDVAESDTTEEVEMAEKRGRGRPRKPVDENAVVEVGEKRGRGRPRKIVVEEEQEEHEKRGRGRPRLQPINSLTRSLTPNSMLAHSNQDIVFASKNVTTTNININVTKTTTSVEDNKATSDDYSHSTTISQQKTEVNTPYISAQDDEIDVDEDLEVKNNNIEEIEDDFDEEIDVSNIKDEAPSGGIEDLLKALLDD